MVCSRSTGTVARGVVNDGYVRENEAEEECGKFRYENEPRRGGPDAWARPSYTGSGSDIDMIVVAFPRIDVEESQGRGSGGG